MNGWLPSIRAEQAMIILVLFGSLFVALGFVSTSAYYNAMGFPPALFPPQSALLGLMGFLYGVPTIFIIAVMPLLGLFGWTVGKTSWFQNIIVKKVKDSKVLKAGILGIAFIYPIGVSVVRTGWVEIPAWIMVALTFIVLLTAGSVFANTPSSPPTKSVKFLGSILSVVLLFYSFISCIIITSSIATHFGRQDVKDILAEKEFRFPTVIPISGEPYKPGKLMVCSERFCGFHDGRSPRIVSLDGIKEIVPDVPSPQINCPRAEP